MIAGAELDFEAGQINGAEFLQCIYQRFPGGYFSCLLEPLNQNAGANITFERGKTGPRETGWRNASSGTMVAGH